MSRVCLRGPDVSFHAQHAPLGAFASLTLGLAGARGGLGLELGKPANQDLYVGIQRGRRDAPGELLCLPFFRASEDAASRFLVEQSAAATTASVGTQGPLAYPLSSLEREYGFGVDRFRTPDFEFVVYTPMSPLPDPSRAAAPELRASLLPAVVATLTVDNRAGTQPITAFYAQTFEDAGIRLLDAGASGRRVGFAMKSRLGVLGEVDAGEAPFLFSRFSLAEGLRDTERLHRLGTVPGIGFVIPAGEHRTLTLAFGWYLGGSVTTGVQASYLYADHYASLEDVLSSGLDRAPELRSAAERLDEVGTQSGLSLDRRFLIAHALRSYQGSTQLLKAEGAPLWVVNEGEYCMLNTLDLSVDHVFLELAQHPWVVKNVLDGFAERYSYADAYGVSFCHDMGVHNHFTPAGTSSYELPQLTGCFSFMTQEELCNWVLTAACYWAKTGDEAWRTKNAGLLTRCLRSMLARADARGIMSRDSSRCAGGAEITTYDSLDASLGQARSNLYLSVKCWATYLGLALLGIDPETCEHQAHTLGRAIAGHQRPSGELPAVLEPGSPGYRARILPAVEGLVYPLYWADTCAGPLRAKVAAWLDRAGPFEALLAALATHTTAALSDSERGNLFSDGGLRLSSTSANSWLSKIALFEHVVERYLRLDSSLDVSGLFERADRAHAEWQRRGSGAFACSDQFLNGVAEGSRYYPRGVTTWLWMGPAHS
jgi:hypothetical protein